MQLSAQFDTVVEYFELKVQDFQKFFILIFILFVNESENFLEISSEKDKVSFRNVVFLNLNLIGPVAVALCFSA
jgi:hypothetical protein